MSWLTEKLIANNFDNFLVISVIYEAEIPNILWLQLLQIEDLLLFSVLYCYYHLVRQHVMKYAAQNLTKYILLKTWHFWAAWHAENSFSSPLKQHGYVPGIWISFYSSGKCAISDL